MSVAKLSRRAIKLDSAVLYCYRGEGELAVKSPRNQPVHKGEKLLIAVTGLGHSGEGVGRIEDYTVFVPGALPKETVLAEITEVKKNYGRAKLLQVNMSSPDRIKPPCTIYQECGGCQLQHLGYDAQLEKKRDTVVAAVQRIGKLADVMIQPTLAASIPWHYRNKMQLPVGQAAGQYVVGCYAQESHKIIPMDTCLIQHDMNNQIAAVLPRIVGELGFTVYDEVSRHGTLRYVMGRVGAATGEVMIVFVTATDDLPQQEKLVAKLIEQIPTVTSIIHNVNKQATNVMLGRKTQVIWGADHITDKLGDLVFRISPHSFFQVNTAQAQLLYEQALRYADLTGTEIVIDAYCGTGTISLFLARQAKQVYGIEIVESAIADAKVNAAANGIVNAEFIAGDATEVLPKLYKQGVKPDVIVVDPPRAGCTVAVLETFAAMQPQRIVYVSCNASSLARDLALLNELGYATREIQPVDMFPQTFHVECVALIERK
jgi:23S rRNA (uracil1939-C5)-methyltransferase